MQKQILDKLRPFGQRGEIICRIFDCDSPAYFELAEALVWLAGKGFIKATFDSQLGHARTGDVIHATITAAGIEHVERGCVPEVEKIEVRLDDEQLKELLITLAGRHGGAGDQSKLAAFLKKTGNAGLNALMAESVKYMLANLPEIARRLG